MGCDTICDLPDSLLTQILLNLPTKYSVKTSVLSTRWRNLWLSVPGLDLATRHFRKEELFAKFVDRFMEFNPGSRLENFKIVGYHHLDRVNELISTVVDCGNQHLNVTLYAGLRCYFMPMIIYKSKTLVSLKLENVGLKNPEFVVSLPCLKIMELRQVSYGKDGPLILEKLISGCPVLEDLELFRPFDILNQEVMLFLRVKSQTLKKCCLSFGISGDDTEFTVEIDAPRLKYMTLFNSQSDTVVVENLSSLLMIDIHTNFKFRCDISSPLQPEGLRKRDIFCDFLTRISSVRHMIICPRTLKLLCCYSKLGPIPQFHNLYHLQAKCSSSSLQLLVAFLESCPNLKSLSLLDICYSKEPMQIDFTNVPRCLISTLEYIEIKKLEYFEIKKLEYVKIQKLQSVEIKKGMMKDETRIIKVVNYFLENSAVLKKLTLSFKQYPCITEQKAESYKKLLTSTKLSPSCQVIID